MIEYVYAYLMSRKHIKDIISCANCSYRQAGLVFIGALLIISLPTALSLVKYVYNIALIGFSIIAINGAVAGLATVLFKKRFVAMLVGLIHIASAAFIINSVILALLYAVGMPFGASEVLWETAATLISTYYFIVLLAVSSTATVEKKNDVKRHAVELTALMLWYVFTFYILALTV